MIRNDDTKILGIDMGFSRVGFAIGEKYSGLAFPREVVEYREYTKKIDWYLNVSGENITTIVVGIPHLLQNSAEDSEHICNIKAEILMLKEFFPSVDIDTFDEQFTTKIAENSLSFMGFSAQKQKGKKDDVAAAIILQGYLDKKRNDKEVISDI